MIVRAFWLNTYHMPKSGVRLGRPTKKRREKKRPSKPYKTLFSRRLPLKGATAKWTGCLFSIYLLSLPAFSLASSSNEKPIPQGSIEFLLGNYNMNEPRFEAVYPGDGFIAGVGLSSALVSNINFYLEIKAYTQKGTLTFTKEETDFVLVPVSLGARYIFPFGLFNPYAGAGVDFYFYYEDNPIGTVLNYANGRHFLAGIYVQLHKKVPILINLKLKHTSARAEENDIKIQLGGLEYSASLTFVF